ncbi:unnamed protein product [Linum trigynum]
MTIWEAGQNHLTLIFPITSWSFSNRSSRCYPLKTSLSLFISSAASSDLQSSLKRQSLARTSWRNEYGVFYGGDFTEFYSTATQKVAKTVDAYLGEIATHAGLTISKSNGIAVLVPKAARKVDDDYACETVARQGRTPMD